MFNFELLACRQDCVLVFLHVHNVHSNKDCHCQCYIAFATAYKGFFSFQSSWCCNYPWVCMWQRRNGSCFVCAAVCMYVCMYLTLISRRLPKFKHWRAQYKHSATIIVFELLLCSLVIVWFAHLKCCSGMFQTICSHSKLDQYNNCSYWKWNMLSY